MGSIAAVDEQTGRKFYLDDPDDLQPDEEVVFLLNLHGGGSAGAWQQAYFPAIDYKQQYRLVIATPSAANKEPSRRWIDEADDEHLQNIVNFVFEKYGLERIRSFWLIGHSQGGSTSSRLLGTDFFMERVDGWLSLSGGRIGQFERSATAGRPDTATSGDRPAPVPTATPDTDMSFIFSVGEHEMASIPDTSPWAEKYEAGPKTRLPDVIDDEPGKIYDTLSEGHSTPAWGLFPRPGTAEVFVFPDARDGRVIADIVRLDKGHTEGYEPKITETLVRMISDAPGGKARTR
jgi:pimeloyl-ACP methyl ester carboxylesterase